MVVKAEDAWKWISPKKTVRYNYPGEQMSSGGRLPWNPLKVLLYDDLVGVVTSHVTNYGGHIIGSTMAETSCCTHESRLCLLYVRSYCEKFLKILYILFVPTN